MLREVPLSPTGVFISRPQPLKLFSHILALPRLLTDQHKNGMPKKILALALNTLLKKSTHHMQPWHLDLVLNEHLKWHLKLDHTIYLNGNRKKTSLKKHQVLHGLFPFCFRSWLKIFENIPKSFLAFLVVLWWQYIVKHFKLKNFKIDFLSPRIISSKHCRTM